MLFHGNKLMLEQNLSMKLMATNYVIPLMHDISRRMQGLTGVSKEMKCEGVAQVLNLIASMEQLASKHENAVDTLNNVLLIMENTYGDEVQTHHNYGYMLRLLGLSPKTEAIEYYKRAIQAYEAATDINDEKRENLVKTCSDKINSWEQTTA